MTFLGRQELIPYGKKRIYARRLSGTRIYVGVHQKGLFQPYWSEKDEQAQTPGQRQKKRWRLEERKFRRFEAGVASTSRGERLAILRTAQKNLPILERALELFENEFREDIISKEFFRLERMPSAIQQELLRHGFMFIKARKQGIRETVVQIYFLLKGIGGTVNVGAFLARATAVTDRLRERLNSIYAWCRKYTDESQTLEAIQRQFDETFKRLEQQLALWKQHEVFHRDRTSDLQQKILQDKMAIVARRLTPFIELQPFAGWAWFTLNDLDQAREAIRKGDYLLAQAVLERIRVSLEIKKKQRKLDDLLWRIEADKALKRWNGDFYLHTITVLSGLFEELAAKEQKAAFKKPICWEVLKYLQKAEALLPEKNFRRLKEPLKKAYLLL